MSRSPLTLHLFSAAGLISLFSGCASIQSDHPVDTIEPNRLHASPCTTPVTIDGILNEPIWHQVTFAPLQYSSDKSGLAQEGGSVALAWDSTHLYLAAQLADSDVLQDNEQDQQPHFKSGDVLELFLKPKDSLYYWELYVTPNGNRTVYFLEGGGRKFLPSSTQQDPSWLQVAATVQGSYNDPTDTDTGWTAEMAIPLTVLASKGSSLTPAHTWSVLVGRYNYSIHLPSLELSMTPAQPSTYFHTPDSWAELKIDVE